MVTFVDVIVPLPLPNLFTYAVTTDQVEQLEVGMRIAVPFGKSKFYTGVVANIHNTAPKTYEAKPLEEILEGVPTVTLNQLRFWRWMSSYYMCHIGEILKAALPSAFLLESETIVELDKASSVDETLLDDEEFLIFEALQHQSLLRISEIMQILEKKRKIRHSS